jgi:hypothetical protein
MEALFWELVGMEATFWELVGMVDNVLAVGWDFCTLYDFSAV